MPLDWLATLLSALGVVLNARRCIWRWPVWLAGSMLWIAYAWPKGEYALVTVNMLFIVLDTYGWRAWHRARLRPGSEA